MFPGGCVLERIALHSLPPIGLTEKPQYDREEASSRRSWILSVLGRQQMIARSVVEFENQFQFVAGRCKLTELHQGRSNCAVAHHNHRLIGLSPGESQALLPQS